MCLDFGTTLSTSSPRCLRKPARCRGIEDFPPAVRFLLRAVGAMNRNGSNLASYLLFAAPFCKALIDLGHRDTMARREEMLAFLGHAA